MLFISCGFIDGTGKIKDGIALQVARTVIYGFCKGGVVLAVDHIDGSHEQMAVTFGEWGVALQGIAVTGVKTVENPIDRVVPMDEWHQTFKPSPVDLIFSKDEWSTTSNPTVSEDSDDADDIASDPHADYGEG